MSTINFGKYIIIEPYQYHFEQMPEWYWEIKAPTSGDELEMAKFLNRGQVKTGFDGITRDAPPTWVEVAHRELAILFVSTNIPNENGEPILAPGASVLTAEKMLKLMPHAMVMEIWRAVGEMVIGWGRAQEAKPETPEDEQDPNLESQETA